jgi:protein-S-isoprenylcysteine O-methyltransferase Ste14
MRLIGIAFLISAATNFHVLAVSSIDTGSAIAGLALYASAAWLFVAALRATRGCCLTVAFTADAPRQLVSTGPYRYIRHPFYACYCLTWLASAASTHSVALLVVFVCMTLLYRWAARFEEEKFSQSELATEYARYRERSGIFLPVFRGVRNRRAGFHEARGE